MAHIRRALESAFIMILIIIGMPDACMSGGILHVFAPSLRNESVAVARPAVLTSRAIVTVSESFIEYRIDQTFFNDNEFPLSGMFILPIDEYEQLGSVDIRIDGVPYPAEIISPEKFFETLKELTISTKDPSLLELSGKRVAVARPVQIGIRGQKTVKCQFRVPTSIKKDLLNISVPLDGERYSLGPVGELEIWVRMKMDRPVRNIFSPTHNLMITRETAGRCVSFVKSTQKKIRDDFLLIASFSAQDPDLQILTHRIPGKKGTFLAMISPPLNPPKGTDHEKDVVFLLESSRSIGQAELNLAKRAIVSGLQRLVPGDRFNILVIDTRPRAMSDRLVAFTDESLARAVRFVNSVPEGGGTDLYNGIIGSLEQFTSRRRLSVVVLVGNGKGTVGITNPEAIIEDLKRNNRYKARIFTLGVGKHLEVALLDKIAASTRGLFLNTLGKEDFEALLNKFYSGISPPQISDIGLELADVSPEDVDPDPIPDQMGTGSVLVLGRYSEDRDVRSRVRLKAKVLGRPKTIVDNTIFPESNPSNSFLPRLWAMRTVGKLLEREWLKGPESERSARLTALSREFGFKLPSSPVQYGSSQQRHSGDLLWQFKTGFSQSGVEAEGSRLFEEKLMRLSSNGVWVDRDFHASRPTKVIDFLSEEYFRIAGESPRLGSILALGPDIIVVIDNQALRIKSEFGPAVQ